MDATNAVSLRPASSDDRQSIQRIVYEAITWNPQESVPPLEQAIGHPELARYHDNWGRHGDAGVLAELGGNVVGGAFYRLFTDDDHGHGYIDDRTPEIAIAVWGAPKRKGIGSGLLDALDATAQAAGLGALSLSVNAANPATNLYRRHGYVLESDDGASLRMLKKL